MTVGRGTGSGIVPAPTAAVASGSRGAGPSPAPAPPPPSPPKDTGFQGRENWRLAQHTSASGGSRLSAGGCKIPANSGGHRFWLRKTNFVQAQKRFVFCFCWIYSYLTFKIKKKNNILFKIRHKLVKKLILFWLFSLTSYF